MSSILLFVILLIGGMVVFTYGKSSQGATKLLLILFGLCMIVISIFGIFTYFL